MVKVSLQTKKKKVARPAVPILHLTLSYVALEMLVARGQERNGTDVVFEVEKVELVSATPSENREDLKCKKGEVLLTWGSIDSSHFSNCVSHPYFINSFFGEETTRLSQRESRSFEIVKVSLDTGIPIWKTSDADRDSDGISDSPCECFTTWNGENIRCVPISTISQICKQATRMIGIKERVLDEGILSNAVSTAWASSGFPISISDGVARSLSSAAHDYRVHRNPDLGALDNLMQLLQPQLVALFARYMLHSCSAASLHPSSGSPNIRHRSVHSALRLRSALMSNFIERDVSSPDAHAKEETVSKALDISIGAAQAVLEPPKCVEILEALSIFMRKKKDGEDKVVGRGETPTLSNDNVVSNIQTIVQSDVKLITASEVHVLVPGMHADSGQDSVGVCSRGGLHLAGNDFTWQGSFHPGSSKNHLQLGALTAHLEKTNNDVAIFPLIEALGFELLTTESSADAGDNDGLFVSLIKLKIDLSLTAAQEATTVVNRVVGPLGYPIAWEPMHLASKRLHNSFQIEVGRAGFSRIVSNQPRLVMAQRQSLSGEIASVSVALKAAEGKNPILQGGVAPMAIRGSESISPFFTFGISQEKASGRMNVVPLLNSLGLFTLNPGLLTSSSTQCQLSVQAQLAHVLLDMQGLTQLIGVVLCLVREILANLPARKESITTLECSEKDAKEGDAANSVLTGWSCTIDLKAAGGDVRVNEALQLKLPLLSLSSVEQDTGSTQPVKPGENSSSYFLRKVQHCVHQIAGLSQVLRIQPYLVLTTLASLWISHTDTSTVVILTGLMLRFRYRVSKHHYLA
ncbi:Major facilitator superfamily domain-containing protein 7-b [Phytophthora nicotianae]|uniref:Major facilitator superfamily domain-containing protein 7-b n=1 Tax=Phytophthora nicotianae TaxID=4792 RepID=A0A0W8D7E0_PHYNI|nr:Major facilitator superfamily domain-containing protein 7-b [Phytophthora nicotianae]